KVDAMENLACANVMEGANMWDAARMVMSGSNDIRERKRIYDWINQNEKLIYSPRSPMHPVGVYFSPASRNFEPDAFVNAYWGTVALLLRSHSEFQIVTPRTLAAFSGSALLLPSVCCLSNQELQTLVSLGRNGVAIRSSGPFGIYKEDGSTVPTGRLQKLERMRAWHYLAGDPGAPYSKWVAGSPNLASEA